MTITPTATSAPEAFGSHLPRGVERDNLERARRYLAAIERSTVAGGAQVSPVYAELRDLPPVLLHVGSTELLLNDATRVHERIRESRGESSLHVYDDVPHCWQMLFPFVPEAVASLRETAAFIDASLHKP